MKTNAKMMAIGLILAVMVMFSSTAIAGTAFQPNGSVSTNLQFTVKIPTFVYFRIDVDAITFEPEMDASGELSTVIQNETVQVTYLSNTTGATISTTGTPPTHASGDFIPWSDFTLTYSSDNGLNPGSAVIFTGYEPDPNGTYLTAYNNVAWDFTFNSSDDDRAGGDYVGDLTYTVALP